MRQVACFQCRVRHQIALFPNAHGHRGRRRHSGRAAECRRLHIAWNGGGIRYVDSSIALCTSAQTITWPRVRIAIRRPESGENHRLRGGGTAITFFHLLFRRTDPMPRSVSQVTAVSRDDEPDILRYATCPMCHTSATLFLSALVAGGDWRCVRCGQHWDATRLATVAAYAAWTVDHDRVDRRVVETG